MDGFHNVLVKASGQSDLLNVSYIILECERYKKLKNKLFGELHFIYFLSLNNVLV